MQITFEVRHVNIIYYTESDNIFSISYSYNIFIIKFIYCKEVSNRNINWKDGLTNKIRLQTGRTC